MGLALAQRVALARDDQRPDLETDSIWPFGVAGRVVFDKMHPCEWASKQVVPLDLAGSKKLPSVLGDIT